MSECGLLTTPAEESLKVLVFAWILFVSHAIGGNMIRNDINASNNIKCIKISSLCSIF